MIFFAAVPVGLDKGQASGNRAVSWGGAAAQSAVAPFPQKQMRMKNDIETLDDVKLLVNDFYAAVREDDRIGPVFNNRIGDRWPEHLEKMYTFWQTVLLEVHTYSGSPFPPHATLNINRAHFDRWVELWQKTVSDRFSGPRADDALNRARIMAHVFLSKIEWRARA